MTNLTRIIREKIAETGSISLADYMSLALGHPQLGYYIKSDPLGARGDFVTSPEISQIFGEMIGVWCVEMWRQMGGKPVSLVELGPGRGTLMADLLRACKGVPKFHDAITIHMVETSPVLANAQYLKLRHMHPRIEWLDSVEQLPDNPMLIIANEFFDALPIKQFQMTEQGVCERRIGWNEDTQQLAFTLAPPGLQLAKSGHIIPPGTIMEQSPASRSTMRQIATHLKTHGGGALIIDYGYLGEAHHDTLQAVKNHSFHPVLKDPGDADITAHVDFTSLAQIASDCGLVPYGPTNQGDFLIRMGAEVRCQMLLKQATEEQKEPIVSGLARITSPQAMGELFKVLAVVSDPRLEPPGFLS
jgi:NADH dehydrogenase [ubiquinone] 1 alpha subcomplex assembly factor 7